MIFEKVSIWSLLCQGFLIQFGHSVLEYFELSFAKNANIMFKVHVIPNLRVSIPNIRCVTFEYYLVMCDTVLVIIVIIIMIIIMIPLIGATSYFVMVPQVLVCVTPRQHCAAAFVIQLFLGIISEHWWLLV